MIEDTAWSLLGALWLLALVVWLLLGVWALRLLLDHASARANLRRRRRRSVVTLTLLLILAAPGSLLTLLSYQVRTHSDLRDAARKMTLDAPRRVGGIDMPAGTTLALARERDPESFESAIFPVPVSAYGVPATRVMRHMRRVELDGRYVPRPQSAWIVPDGDQTVVGWRCSATGGPDEHLPHIGVSLAEDGITARFEDCVAAAGNTVAGRALPAGAKIMAANGLPGAQWLVDFGNAGTFMHESVVLANARLALDPGRQLLRVTYATLPCRRKVGALRYPRGTQVSTGGDWAERFPNAWEFRMPPDRTAVTDRKDVGPGSIVRQALDGTVFDVLPVDALPPLARFAPGEAVAHQDTGPEQDCEVWGKPPAPTPPPKPGPANKAVPAAKPATSAKPEASGKPAAPARSDAPAKPAPAPKPTNPSTPAGPVPAPARS